MDFEDDRISGVQVGDLQRLLDAFYRRAPELRDRDCALFLDEIQNVPGWERFVRRVQEQENVHVTLSGSSAKLLSREIATSLRGRSLATELFPFSVVEALEHAKLRPVPHPGKRASSAIENFVDGYLIAGGFPEVQPLSADLRQRVLRDYLDVAVLRDVIERHQIAGVVALRRLVRQLFTAAARPISVHKLHRDLRSQGVAVGKDSLHAWIGHLEDAYVLFGVPVHSDSERVRQSNPRKFYPVDPGLVVASSRSGAPDLGRQLEICVFLELRRRTREVTYYTTERGHEVDFFAEGALLQACATLDDAATREREVRALTTAMKELGLRDGTIVTLRDEPDITTEAGLVRCVPFWRWCVERAQPSAPPTRAARRRRSPTRSASPGLVRML